MDSQCHPNICPGQGCASPGETTETISTDAPKTRGNKTLTEYNRKQIDKCHTTLKAAHAECQDTLATMERTKEGSEIPPRMVHKAQLAVIHANTTVLELHAILEQGWMSKNLKELRQEFTAALDSMKQSVDIVNACWTNLKGLDDGAAVPANPPGEAVPANPPGAAVPADPVGAAVPADP